MTKLQCINPINLNDLKILKVGYLINRLLDHTQILNLSLDDHTIFLNHEKKTTLSGKRSQNIKSGISIQPLYRS